MPLGHVERILSGQCRSNKQLFEQANILLYDEMLKVAFGETTLLEALSQVRGAFEEVEVLTVAQKIEALSKATKTKDFIDEMRKSDPTPENWAVDIESWDQHAAAFQEMISKLPQYGIQPRRSDSFYR